MLANVEAGRETLRNHQDPLAPDAVEAYFRLLYWRKGPESLDKHGVLAKCEEEAKKLDFPFEFFAASLHLIDDVMAPIIVEHRDKEPQAVIAMLQGRADPLKGRELRQSARVLQRYTVGVPPSVRAELLENGLAKKIRPNLYEDQFVRLVHRSLYESSVGIEWSDPTFIAAERLMG